MQQVINVLALLACPLMMVFCMGGLFRKNKSCHNDQNQNDLSQKVDALQKQLDLIKELESIKNQRNAS
ncbi:DUF2933 domain-containing protein [Paenibacillus alginolyticus]|uniref:DUF2933 domain-containing protein n=1 Tax=Paenibacillus alginolyticus TaxID=59839 RepID=UPI00040060D5|nr:DUF2933 domain-containing protein [Paenibacillus alginolyticus]MCY9666382.1 DUF2933 domain-containing protein [Paenibacillus alginolyticus]